MKRILIITRGSRDEIRNPTFGGPRLVKELYEQLTTKGFKVSILSVFDLSALSAHLLRIRGKDASRLRTSFLGAAKLRWFVANFTIKKDYNTIIIRNIKGRNAINIIIILLYEKFFIFSKEIKEILNWKKIILLRDLGERHITIFNTLDIDAITVQSIEYKDGMYVLDVLTETEQVGVGIIIPEQYHGGWVAFVDESQEILSTPHIFVNNFWVTLRDRGSHKIRIEFVPQKTWIVIYTVNGLLTFLILTFCLLYLFYDQQKSGQRV